MANEDLKRAAKNKGVLLWEIAEHLGCTDTTFSKRLRSELPAEEKAKVHEAIRAIAKEKAERD